MKGNFHQKNREIPTWLLPCSFIGMISSGIMGYDLSGLLKRISNEQMGIKRYIIYLLSAICFICVLCVIFCGANRIHASKSNRKSKSEGKIRGREWTIYVATFLLVTLGLFILYSNVDLSYPMVFTNGDEMGAYAQIKSISQNGVRLINPLEGGMTGADMYDYPFSDKLSFLIVKGISVFVKNPYTIAALFYFLNYHLVAAAGVFVCRKMKLDRTISVTIGVLYAFSPFLQLRFSHLWLTPYYMLPFACLIAWEIMEGKIVEEDVPLRRNRLFWKTALICYACAFTGLYYAFFTCAILAAAGVIRLFTEKDRRWNRLLYPLALIGFTVSGVITNVFVSFMYTRLMGPNPLGEMSLRLNMEAELYALKLDQMLLPRPIHRIGILRKITDWYSANYPLVNENMTSSLGIVAGIGFTASLLMLLSGNRKYGTIASLNMSMFLIGTIGGIGGLISVFVLIPARSYNRLSLMIMFLSLVMIGMLLENLLHKRKKRIIRTLCVILLVAGFYDQTIQWQKPDYTAYESTRNLVRTIEAQLEPGDSVFMLPYDNWPSTQMPGGYKMHMGYLESDTLRWSYGGMQGRGESIWQKETAEKDCPEMIRSLSETGYSGIYLDRGLMINQRTMEEIEQLIQNITDAAGEEPTISDDLQVYFWKIR